MNKREIRRFFFNNRKVFALLCLLLIIGIVAGTLCVKTLTDVQKTEMIEYLNNFFTVIQNNTEGINKNQVFTDLLIDNAKIYILLFIFGLFKIGVICIPCLILFKGFILGFTIGFILDELYLMGFLFSLLVIFPQNILYLAGLLFSSMIGFILSQSQFTSHRSSIKLERSIRTRKIFYYFSVLLIGYIITIVGSIFEAYISPVFMIFFSNKLF